MSVIRRITASLLIVAALAALGFWLVVIRLALLDMGEPQPVPFRLFDIRPTRIDMLCEEQLHILLGIGTLFVLTGFFVLRLTDPNRRSHQGEDGLTKKQKQVLLIGIVSAYLGLVSVWGVSLSLSGLDSGQSGTACLIAVPLAIILYRDLCACARRESQL